MPDTPNYKHTMNLPKTSFKMKASLAQHEPERLKKWEDMDLYYQILAKNEGHESYILHDGPPYANGPIHIGHSLNKILKDIIVKYHAQRGYYAPYVPGWDCHGLPIENKVEEELGPEKMAKIDVPTFRKICREYAEKQVDGQRKGFKRLGVSGDWGNPYLTFNPEYEAGNIEVFKDLYLSGAIYRGRKPIHWCTHCHTALAEAEIEYADEVSPSVFVKFRFTEVPEAFKPVMHDDAAMSVIIWTTTPWTLPANTAVSLSPDAEYVAVRVRGEYFVLARELLESVAEKAGWSGYEVVEQDGEPFVVRGVDLAGATYRHPIHPDMTGTLIYGDHVTLDTGTGAVHTAPGHGADDYEVGLKFNVPVLMPVDDDGKFMQGGGPWAGKDAVESNEDIIAWLDEDNALIAREDISHSYPHCWRCKRPVIFRATTQWFVSMDKTGLREKALEQINDNVQWIPAWASNRIGSMVEERPDWCISRQRFWGVPIPVFKCKSCGEIVANEESFDAVIELFRTKGADAWYTTAPEDYLPSSVCCPNCGSHELEGEKDVLDVWWESGVSHTSVLGTRPYLHRPADLYLEGSDQHRGWFQSSLLTSVGAYGDAPYKAVLSCGFTVDENGRKMSKSIGNVIDPIEVCDEFGADVLRLWVGSVDYSQDMSVSRSIFERTSDAYRRIRNTFRYLLSNLNDFTNDDYVSAGEMLEFDKWALSRLQALVAETTQAFDEYRFHSAYRAWYDFIVSISSEYFDAVKDRLYADAADSVERRSAQSVLANMLEAMVRQLAPILVFTCDEVWEKFPEGMMEEGRVAAIALAGWPDEEDFAPQLPKAEREELLASYEVVMDARDAVMKAIEEARNDGLFTKSQEAAATIMGNTGLIEALAAHGLDTLAEIFIVSCVELEESDDADGFVASVSQAPGEKCPRCWNYRELGPDGLCERCHEVVAAFDMQVDE